MWTPRLKGLFCFHVPWISESQEEHLKPLLLQDTYSMGRRSRCLPCRLLRGEKTVQTIKESPGEFLTISKPNKGKGRCAGSCSSSRGVRKRPCWPALEGVPTSTNDAGLGLGGRVISSEQWGMKVLSSNSNGHKDYEKV